LTQRIHKDHPLLKEIKTQDHSFFIKTLGIPGPYSNYMERKLGSEGLLRVLKIFSDRSAYFEIAAVCAWPEGRVRSWIYQAPVIIAENRQGNSSGDWDEVLMFEGEKRTFAEYPLEERIDVWAKNFEEIAKAIIAGEL